MYNYFGVNMKCERIEKLLNKMIDDNVFPGANYALLTKNNYYFGSVGNKCLVPKVEENSVDTLYDLASLSKVIVTNTIITKLLYSKKIKLEDKVCKFLPRFKYDNITIIDLLTHSSGLVSDLSWRTVNSKDQLLDNLFNLELKYPPGEQVIYSDIGFILLGLIIEEIYKKRLDKVAEEEVFIPLDMRESYYNPVYKERCAATEVTENRGVVRGTVHDEKAEILGGIAGHAGVFSTVNDVAKFCQMIQNKGKVGNSTFLPEEYIDLWFNSLRKVDENQFRSIGWIVGTSKNITGSLGDFDTIYHTGFTGNTIIISRKLEICAILLANRVHPTRENRKLITRRKDFYRVCYKVNELEQKVKVLNKQH